MDTVGPRADDPAELAAALRLVVGRISRRMRHSRSTGEVTMSEMSVLARLDREGPDSPGSLAEQERVRPQAMAVTLAALEEQGLVRRGQDATDGRRAVITLTPAGRKVVVGRRSEMVKRLTEVIEDEFTGAERRRLLAAVPLLERLAERL